MADVGLRDLGNFVPGGRAKNAAQEPSAPVIPLRPPADPLVLVTPPPPPQPTRAVFAGDRPDGRDVLGIDATLAILAELAAHRRTTGPLCIGLLGGAGSGKSFALARLAARIRDLAAAAGKTDKSPFLSRVHVETIDAASLEGDAGLAIAAKLHGGLRRPYPELAREIGAVARDPHVVLREAEDKLDESRRRLDAERRAMDDAGSRRARLTETVLYEAAGSQVDAYARANRAGIESRLIGFGLPGDPIRTYKDLVQLVAGAGGKLGLTLRALWAFKGQTKLILAAIVLVAIGIGLGVAIDDQDNWLGALRGSPKGGASVADWLEAHLGLVATLKTGAFALALLALAVNVLRAVSFLRPIFKGARLLDTDLDTRRRDLDGLYAHQTKRVDALEADVERLTRAVSEAERRLGGGGSRQDGVAFAASPFAATGAAAQGQAVFAALADQMAEAVKTSSDRAPHRIVLALDHLDTIAPERAHALLDALHRAAAPGLVTLAGLDPTRIDASADLERWIQVPVRLDALASPIAAGTLVREALGHAAAAPAASPPDARRSELDAPISDEEAGLLAALADLAGRTPRALKRFANLYVLARIGEERRRGALAFMLALAQGGTAQERRQVGDALAGDSAAPFELPLADGRLRAAYDVAIGTGGRLTRAEAADAVQRAATFSIAATSA